MDFCTNIVQNHWNLIIFVYIYEISFLLFKKDMVKINRTCSGLYRNKNAGKFCIKTIPEEIFLG